MDTGNSGGIIPEWFRGRSIFVTGGTGFMGKVLLEKLLRSCPDIHTIFLLMRPKRGSDIRSRLDELLNTTIFDWLRKEHPEALNKLVPISGDIMQPELGISQADQKILADSVSVVFHSAATVKFDEAIKISVGMNLLGTKRLVQLCHKMTKLEALIHVSTAYCNCDRQDINETVYPPPADPEKIIQCVEWMDEDLLESITPKIIGNRPNTYTYTKALAEHVLIEQSGGLPVAIVRPSIVTAAWKEPIPGWVDNLNGPTGLLAGAGKGVLRSILCYGDLVADLVPVDIAINLLIAVAWHTATARPNNVLIYNCTSGSLNPIRWKDIEDLGHEYILRFPFNDVLWYPGGSFKKSRFVNNVCILAFHKIPAYIIDTLARISGKKPMIYNNVDPWKDSERIFRGLKFELASFRYIRISSEDKHWIAMQEPYGITYTSPLQQPIDTSMSYMSCLQHLALPWCHSVSVDAHWPKAIMVRVQKKLQRAVSCLEFFTTHEWRFSNENVKRLLSHIHPQDRKIFDFDITALNWRSYLENYVLGTRKFVLKEDPSTFPAARSHLRKMYWVHRISQVLMCVVIWRLLMLRSETARQLWFTLFSLMVRLANYVPHK